ncbi:MULTISPECIES: phage tail protein [unclassified Saccharicrinis]|uniref:phage tail protein n=1 Tax=unclassified Saccharicrinis TaxID=2646859 RepID=UPI003D332F9B
MKKHILIVCLLITSTGIMAQEPFIGEVRMFAGNYEPRGWAFCDGQLLSIANNSALFSILGTTYGGDGRTTFALPDLRSRVPMHPGQGPGLSRRVLGEKSGTENNTLNITQLPSHSHSVSIVNHVYDDEANSDDPTGTYPAVSGENMYSTNQNANGGAPNVSIGNTGANQAVNNVQPYITVNYIIALTGIYPSRN